LFVAVLSTEKTDQRRTPPPNAAAEAHRTRKGRSTARTRAGDTD